MKEMINPILHYVLAGGVLGTLAVIILFNLKAIGKGLFGEDGIQFIELVMLIWIVCFPVALVSDIFLDIEVSNAAWGAMTGIFTFIIGGKIANDKINKNGKNGHQ